MINCGVQVVQFCVRVRVMNEHTDYLYHFKIHCLVTYYVFRSTR